MRLSPSWMRAKSWICSRISALEGRSSGLTPPATEPFGGLAFGGEVLGLDALVHQAGGFEGDGLTEFDITHPFMRRYQAHQCGAGLWEESTSSIISTNPAKGEEEVFPTTLHPAGSMQGTRLHHLEQCGVIPVIDRHVYQDRSGGSECLAEDRGDFVRRFDSHASGAESLGIFDDIDRA